MTKVEENEQKFQKAYDDWVAATNELEKEKHLKTMYDCVFLCCCNIAKKKAVGIHIPDLEEKCMDATINIIAKIQSGVRPKKLSSYCYLWTIGQLYNKKHKQFEESVSFDETLENYAYVEKDNIITLCRQEY